MKKTKEENLLDHRQQNARIKKSLKASIEDIFPIKSGGKRLELSNVNLEDDLSETDFPAQKKTRVNRKTWEMPIKADIKIYDEGSDQVIDKKSGVKIGAIPKITNRLSTIVKGNEYQVSNQIRRKPGVFSRKKKNGQLESEFNLEKGANFALQIDPQKQLFYFTLKSGTRRYHLYNLLASLGMSDTKIRKAWGKKLFEKNKKDAINTEASEINDLYKKLLRKDPPGNLSAAREGLRDYFENTSMDGDVNKITIGSSHTKASADSMLDASTKLLKINKGEEKPDERDSLIFKRLYAPDDLLQEHFKGRKETLKRKMQNSLKNRDKVREVVSANEFTKPIRSFFTTSDLSATPPQTNPVAMAVNARKTTSMGEGGIQNMHAITMETRDVHPSQLGFLDGLSTPEGLKIGVNVGLASEVVKKGKDMATPVVMPNGDIEYKTPIEMHEATVGFPDQFEMKNGKPKAKYPEVKVMDKGDKPQKVNPEKVDFWIRSAQSLFDFGANLVPFLQNTQGNRGSTAARMITQALPLDDPDTPNSVVKRDEKSTYEDLMGSYLLPSLEQETGDPNSKGTVTKVTDDYIHISTDKGEKVKVGLYNDFPLNQDGYLNTKPIVKKGDKVKGDDLLAKSNYTDDKGRLALGKNLTVAYLSYKGNSFEDGATITESAAKKLSHTTIDRKNVFYNPKKSTLNKKKFRSYFPEELSATNASKLDSRGLPKVGEEFNSGEALTAFLVKKEADGLDKSLRKLDKSVYTPYKKKVEVWEEDDPGKVVDVKVSGRNIDIYVKSTHPFKEGDKVSSRYGDKHIIGKIIPDEEAPHRPDGTPVDIMVNPQGVQGRMNMGQLLDTAVGKIAEKEGKPFEVENFDSPDGDKAQEIKEKLKEKGIEANEVLTDGKNGKPLENPVFVGNRQYLKLRHLVKKKQSSHSFGVYDIEEQPAGKGAQKLGNLETYAYLGHGAKNLLREATTIKGQQNEEYFRNLQFGLPPSKPKQPFVFDKMMDYLKVSGVDVNKEGNKMQLIPLTDEKIDELSKGEIPEPGQMLIGKNLASKKGGLFDDEITGGQQGENYNHISLPKRMPNPMAETAIKSILDMTNKQYDAVMAGEDSFNGKTGSEAIVSALEDLDVDEEFEKTKKELNDAPKSSVNKLNTKVRILDALKKKEQNAKDAYTTEKVLVIPPKMRPVYPLPSGDLQVSDINKHYRDVGLKAKGLKSALDSGSLTKEDEDDYTNKLYYSMKAMQGFVDPITYGKQKYKGALKDLGETKKGLIFGKAWAKRQDLSGRSTITPEPSFGLDEVGIPEKMAKDIMKPFVVRKLKQSGMSASKALKEVKDDTDLAKSTLQKVMEEKPVVLNRAPTLHKHSVQAFKSKIVPGKEIRLNPLVVSGFNADFDGDTMSVNVPVSYEAEQDAKSMFPSKILFKHGDKSLVPELSQEYLYGISKISQFGKKTGKSFNSIEEAKEAGLNPTDVFKLNGEKMTIGQHEINKVLPEKYRDYSRTFKYKEANDLLEKIAKNEDSETFKDIINHYKDVGALYQYKHGATVSIDDMVFDRSYRDELIKKYKPRIEKLDNDEDKAKAYIELTNKMEKEQNKQLKGNRMIDLVESGAVSQSKAGNIRQVLTAPGIVAGTDGKPIPIPIFKSYSEGLDTFDYYNTLPGVRKGVVDKSVNTQESGALNKQLLAVNRRQLIVEEDCGTTDGREYEISNKNIMDRAALETVPGVVQRNDIIDSEVINKAKEKDIDTLKVRTPLKCDSSEGMCALCYGVLPDGDFPSVGTNVGVLESQALSERSTQLTLQTFHSGGAAGGDEGVVGSFPRLEQLLKVPQRLSGKAALAPIRGEVKSVRKNEIGGYDIEVGSKSVTAEPGRKPIVKKGDKVKKGDALTDGPIKPQELGDLKDHYTAQKYIVDEISNVYDNSFHDKTIETVIRGISDNAEVTKAPEDSNLFRGDKRSMSSIKKLNRERELQDQEPVEFKPYFKSIDTLNVDNDDWFTKITTNRVKAGLSKGMAKMQWTDIAGKDPIPAYIYGEDFGKPEKKREDEDKGFF